MEPSRADVERMVQALFTVTASLERARRRKPGAGRLSLLLTLVDGQGMRPSAIASALEVSPSLVTRQVQALEDEGLLTVSADPADSRSCQVSLTQQGYEELALLAEAGIARFEAFVAGWDASEVVSLARLLEKLEADKHAVATSEARRARRPRWAQGSGARAMARADRARPGETSSVVTDSTHDVAHPRAILDPSDRDHVRSAGDGDPGAEAMR